MVLDGAGWEILDREECLRLLARANKGRVAISVQALPIILPVRFVVYDDRIVIRTSLGTTLDGATRGTVVAFQADGTESSSGRDWSVQVTGLATDSDAISVRYDLLPRWSTTRPDRLVSITTDHVSGRREPAWRPGPV